MLSIKAYKFGRYEHKVNDLQGSCVICEED